MQNSLLSVIQLSAQPMAGEPGRHARPLPGVLVAHLGNGQVTGEGDDVGPREPDEDRPAVQRSRERSPTTVTGPATHIGRPVVGTIGIHGVWLLGALRGLDPTVRAGHPGGETAMCGRRDVVRE